MNEQQNAGFQSGQVLVATWGYDQTNATFVKVEKVTGKFATVRQLVSEHVWEGQSMTGYAMPTEELDSQAKPMRRKIHAGWDGEPMVQLSRYGGCARVWNGRPVAVSCYA